MQHQRIGVGVRHDVFHVVARLKVGNGLDEGRRLDGTAQGRAPDPRARGTRIVGRGRKREALVERLVERAQIGRSQDEVHLDVADAVRFVSVEPELLGHPGGGLGHELHEAARAYGGARLGNEAGLLSDETVGPFRRELLTFGTAFDHGEERRGIAKTEV